ncbi:MAG: ribonuclease P protein component [Woeseiaceae bacterium]
MNSPFRAATTTDNKAGSATENRYRQFRLKPGNRLPDAAAFSRVFSDAKRSRDSLFTVLSRTNGMPAARLGLAISKKHCRAASGRNRLKRVVRESFRQHQEELAGLDVVVLGQPGTSRADNHRLFDSLVGHWQRTRAAHVAASDA